MTRAESQSPLKISRTGQIHIPKDEILISLPISEWRRCMKRVGQIASDPGRLENLAYALLGLAGGTVVSAITLYASVEYSRVDGAKEVVNWKGLVSTCLLSAIGFAAFISGGASLYHAWDKRRMQESASEDLLAEMDDIEKRCLPAPIISEAPKVEAPAPAPTPPPPPAPAA